MRIASTVYVSLLGLGWSLTAFAYIPPSQFIIKNWANKHSTTHSIRIHSIVTAMEMGKPTEIKFKEVTWFNPSHLTVKSQAYDDQDRPLYYSEKNGSTLSLIERLLFSRDAKELSRVLIKKEVPIRLEEDLLKFRTEAERRSAEEVSLSRWNKKIAWQVGTRLWIEKDTFFPLRLIYSSSHNVTDSAGSSTVVGDDYDVRFDEIRTSHDLPYPKVIQVYSKEGWIFSSQLVDIQLEDSTNHSHATKPDHKAPPAHFPVGFSELGRNSSSALRSLVQVFYDSLR